MLIDTHAHVNDNRLLPYAAQIASDMDKDGLLHIINVGWDAASSKKAVELAEQYDQFFATVGIHPHDAKNARLQDYDDFSKLADHPKVVAYGEIGLDYYYQHSDRETQKKVFVEQLELAYALKLPTVIHLRDAYADMSRLLQDNKKYLAYGFVLHCYSGSAEMVKEYAKLGACFSLGGAITFKNANKEPVARAIPQERLLLETDCPYMTPVPHRGKDNYPRYIKLVAEQLSQWFPDRDIAWQTSANARRFFGLQ